MATFALLGFAHNGLSRRRLVALVRLTVLDPVYLFVIFGLYPQVFVLAPLPGKILGALLLTALCAWQQVTLAGGIGGNFFLITLGVYGHVTLIDATRCHAEMR